MKISVCLTGVMKHSELGRNFEIDMESEATIADQLSYLDYPSEHTKQESGTMP